MSRWDGLFVDSIGKRRCGVRVFADDGALYDMEEIGSDEDNAFCVGPVLRTLEGFTWLLWKEV